MNKNDFIIVSDYKKIYGFHKCTLIRTGQWYDRVDAGKIIIYCENNDIEIIDVGI